MNIINNLLGYLINKTFVNNIFIQQMVRFCIILHFGHMNKKQDDKQLKKQGLSESQINKYIQNMLQFDYPTDLSSKDHQEYIEANTITESLQKLDLYEQATKEKDNKKSMPKQIDKVVLQGFLERQSQSFFKTKNIQYAVLSSSKLYFFQNQSRIRLLSCLSFKYHKAAVSLQQQIITIFLYDISLIINLKARTSQQTLGWYASISQIIEYNKLHKKIVLQQDKLGLYQQKDALTQQQLFEIAETGDIVLMSTLQSQCAIQRFVTNSQYDHIALIVKFKEGLKIFESNVDQGVNLYDWHQFHSDFNHYSKISLRKLHYSKKELIEPHVIKFIKQNLGNQYHLNAFKLFRKTSDDAPPPKRGFFCSQLVAKIYKNAGLLCPNRASSNYWPIDFTERGGLQLRESAYLGQQKLIILKKHIKYT